MNTETKNYMKDIAKQLNVSLKVIKDGTKKARSMREEYNNFLPETLYGCYMRPSNEKITIDKRIRSLLTVNLIYNIRIATYNTCTFKYNAILYHNTGRYLIELTKNYLYILDYPNNSSKF